MSALDKRRTGPAARLAAAVALVVLAVSLSALSSCQSRTRPDNVVLITVDTMRADRVGLYGYQRPTTPNLDRWFADQGRLYLRSYSTEASTTPSVVSLLTGLLPQQHRVRMLIQLVPPELELLPDILGEQWQSAGFVSNMMLTSEASGLGRHFDYYDDFVDQRELYRGDTFERSAARTTDAVLAWLEAGRPAQPGGDADGDPDAGQDETHDETQDAPEDESKDRPLFLWVHYMDPHGPYHAPDDWPRTFTHDAPLPIDVTRIPSYEREPGVDDGLAYVDAYDEEIAYTDFHVGRLLDGLDSFLDLDRTLVIFTADHGESMMEHEFWFRHAVQVYDEMVRVPLMLRGPGVVPGRSDLLTSGTDVLPTVLTALGMAPRPLVPAVDLRSGKGLSPSRIVYTEASLSARDGDEQWRAAVQDSMKWMIGVRKGNCQAVTRRYDLAADPFELTIKVWTSDGEAPRSLLRLCREDPDPAGIPVAWSFGQGLKGPKSPPMDADEQLRSLRALGYAE